MASEALSSSTIIPHACELEEHITSTHALPTAPICFIALLIHEIRLNKVIS